MVAVIRKRARPCVLFVHNNFPGQFGFLARMLVSKGIRCAAIGSDRCVGLEAVDMLRWTTERGSTETIFPPATKCEADMLRGVATLERALDLKRSGLEPKVIIAHPGWGETLFLKEAFPDAKQILYGEFYYHSQGADTGFDPEFGSNELAERVGVSAKNATLSMAYALADRIVAPTPFQASLLPSPFRRLTDIIHEGIDASVLKRRTEARFQIDGGPALDASTPVITFVNRCFEPLRGYHIFMRSLPRVLAECPDAHVLLIGESGERGYGVQAPPGRPWRDIYLEEVSDRLDMSRVHFVGTIGHDRLIDAYSISSAHVYLTYPFVLSWSLMEAMATGCAIVASDTAPVRDVVEDGETGVLVDFFDHDALADAIVRMCTNPSAYEPMRGRARDHIVQNYDQVGICAPAWLRLVEEHYDRTASTIGPVRKLL